MTIHYSTDIGTEVSGVAKQQLPDQMLLHAFTKHLTGKHAQLSGTRLWYLDNRLAETNGRSNVYRQPEVDERMQGRRRTNTRNAEKTKECDATNVLSKAYNTRERVKRSLLTFVKAGNWEPVYGVASGNASFGPTSVIW